MPKFTKGPWRVAKVVESHHPKPHTVYVLIDDGRKRNVCAVSVYGRDENDKPTKTRQQYGERVAAPSIGDEECMANARLIARAPAMLRLLEKLLPAIEEEAERRESAPHAGRGESYWSEMRELVNDVQAEVARAYGRDVPEPAEPETCPHGYGFVEYCPTCKDRKNDDETLADDYDMENPGPDALILLNKR